VTTRRAALALAGGLALYVVHPPVGWGWLAVVALVPLLALGRDIGASSAAPARVGFGWGLVAGLAFFTPLLYWIAYVELIALPLLAATLALSTGVFVAGAAAWGHRPWRPVAMAVWWVAVEAARSQWPFDGFPWGVLGYAQADGGLFLPVARTLGVLGVSLACAAVAACVEEVVARWLEVWRSGERAGFGEVAFARARGPLLGLLGVLVVGVLLGGDPPPPGEDTLDVAAVQGNDIDDTESLTQSRVLAVADRMVELTAELEGDIPDLVVWPENSLDVDVRRDPELRPRVEAAKGVLGDTPLLSGLLLDAPNEGRGGLYNTMAELGPSGEPLDVYKKRSLVPFGEYVPLRELVGWFPPLERAGNFVPGDEPGVFELAGARVATVICFENNFPALTRSQVREGAEVLVVSTNNASFDRSPASAQHIAFSQLRAVESGRWVLHAAISGSSAVVDPEGATSQVTGLFEQAIVRDDLPLVTEDTLYTRAGDLVGPATMAAAVLGLAWLAWERYRIRQRGAGPARGAAKAEPGR
jgi:apolipoprotein N-acyltransferase